MNAVSRGHSATERRHWAQNMGRQRSKTMQQFLDHTRGEWGTASRRWGTMEEVADAREETFGTVAPLGHLRPEWPALLLATDDLPRPLRAALDTLDEQIRKIHDEAILAA